MENGEKSFPVNSSPMDTVSCRSRPWELKETARCVFCLGANCKRCSENAYLNAHSPAIEKFHCNWITDEVMAMQRPADELFESIDLLGKFKSLKISAVLNLTEPGEHPFCGYGLKPSGFPYSPEKLMAVGIKHFNFAWRDMTAPSISLTQNIVRVGMAELLEGGKVAIHCHAGYGRTGIVVACLVMARTGMSADEAVKLVRTQRPGSVQTSAQLSFIRDFEREYLFQKSVYPSINLETMSRSREDNPQDVPSIILSKPPLRRKTTISETINQSFRRSSMFGKILPSTPTNNDNTTPSIRLPSPLVSPSSSISSPNSASALTSPPPLTSASSASSSSSSLFYLQLKTIDMSIIDEKLCNIELSHPHHEISSRQLGEQQTFVPTHSNYYNQSSSIILQLIFKLFRSISQSYHPLYLCGMLCGYAHIELINEISSSLQQNNHNPIDICSLLRPLSQSELTELMTNLRQYRLFTNQSDRKRISEMRLIVPSEGSSKKRQEGQSDNNPSSPSTSTSTLLAPSVHINQEESPAASSTSTPFVLHSLNALTLSNLFFDWFDTREDTLFSPHFLTALQSEAPSLLSITTNSSPLPTLSQWNYHVSPSLLSPPLHSSTPSAGPSQSPQPQSQQSHSNSKKIVPTSDNSNGTVLNLLDLFLRKHLSRSKLSILEDLLTLFHQFDALPESLFQKYHLLIFAMEMRVAMSCLQETHHLLLIQYLTNELEKDRDRGEDNDFSVKKDSSKEESQQQPQQQQRVEETTILSLLFSKSRQMNISTLSTLLSSGVILISSNPSLSPPFSSSSASPSSPPSQITRSSSLSMTPQLSQSLSDLLLVINLFHSLLAINWVSSKRNVKHTIRWRRSFAEKPVDETHQTSPR